MARHKDANSTRQRVFTKLEQLLEVPRSDAVEQIMEEFKIARPYAMTLYQTHRTSNKKKGKYTKVYKVRDVKDGAGVDPYLSTSFVLAPKRSDAKTLGGAVSKYESELQRKATLASKLK